MLTFAQQINHDILRNKTKLEKQAEKESQKALCKITFESFAKGTTE